MAELTEEEKKKLREATGGLSFNGSPLTPEMITSPQMPQETQDLSLMGLPDISQPPIYSTAAQAFGGLPMDPIAGASPQQPLEGEAPDGGAALAGVGLGVGAQRVANLYQARGYNPGLGVGEQRVANLAKARAASAAKLAASQGTAVPVGGPKVTSTIPRLVGPSTAPQYTGPAMGRPVPGTQLSAPRQLPTLSGVAKPVATTGSLASKASKLAKFSPTSLGYAIADTAVEGLTGKGISERVGEGIGGTVANLFYGDTSQPAMTEEEMQRITGATPATAPVAGERVPRSPSSAGMYGGGYYMPPTGGAGLATQLTNAVPGMIHGTMSYGKTMSNVAEPSAEAPTEVAAATAQGSEEPLSPFEGSFLAPDGTTVGLLRGGGRRIMTPQDMALFDAMNEARGQPSVIGGATPSMPTPEGMQRTMSGGEVMFADPTTAAAIGGRESERIFGRPGQVQTGEAGSPQAEFAARVASGEPLSEQEIAGYQAKAAEMGTTFDPQRGYSREAFLASQRRPSGIQQASFESEQRQAVSDREKRGGELSLGDYRNMLRAEGWKGSAQIAKAKQMMGEALSEREEAMIDKQGKLLDQQRTQQIIEQAKSPEAKSPEATPFQKKRGEWLEREESLREDGASPEEIAARRRAFLYGDKFDAWEFEGNGTQPQMETAATGGATPTVTDEASYNALKSGQKYIHNGKEYTKK